MSRGGRRGRTDGPAEAAAAATGSSAADAAAAAGGDAGAPAAVADAGRPNHRPAAAAAGSASAAGRTGSEEGQMVARRPRTTTRRPMEAGRRRCRLPGRARTGRRRGPAAGRRDEPAEAGSTGAGRRRSSGRASEMGGGEGQKEGGIGWTLADASGERNGGPSHQRRARAAQELTVIVGRGFRPMSRRPGTLVQRRARRKEPRHGEAAHQQQIEGARFVPVPSACLRPSWHMRCASAVASCARPADDVDRPRSSARRHVARHSRITSHKSHEDGLNLFAGRHSSTNLLLS
jgi:hypothetical protein